MIHLRILGFIIINVALYMMVMKLMADMVFTNRQFKEQGFKTTAKRFNYDYVSGKRLLDCVETLANPPITMDHL